MTETPSPPPPLTLTYDDYVPARDPRARWILPGYILGTLLCGLLYGLILTTANLFRTHENELFSFWWFGIAIGVIGDMLMLLPSLISLGLCLWIRGKFLHQIRFARFRTAFLTGIVGALYPLPLAMILPDISEQLKNALFLGGLAWHILFPIAAGFWLCYRSTLRD